MKRFGACWRAGFGAAVLVLAGCASNAVSPRADGADDDSRLIIVAVDEAAEPLPAAGATPRLSYTRGNAYAGSARAVAVAADVARDHGLQERAAWTIVPLNLRCMLYRIPAGARREPLLTELGLDPRVRLAQPQNRFETFAQPAADHEHEHEQQGSAQKNEHYNDPYVGLQRGFAAIDAAEAQRWSRGEGVRVALIDTGVDATHPDLQGRVADQRDFVGSTHAAAPGGELHGTQMAGVIAADANNRIGIVGVAPMARLLALRACWPVAGGGSRCDSFTLAQALAASIAAGADVINLSLGGPADPLLQRLVEQALKRGAIVVGAMPPDGSGSGFPVGIPGVLAVDSSDDFGPPRPGLAAPGREILTLSPGGSYGFASGSSLSAAHVSGAVALLRALDSELSPEALRGLLDPSSRLPHASVDACVAIRRLRPDAACATLAQREESARR